MVNNDKLPTSLLDFFNEFKEYVENKRYDNEFQVFIEANIQESIDFISEDPRLERIVQLTSSIPEWFRAWSLGKKVFIDLSACNRYVKWILSVLIFQLVKFFIPHSDNTIPQGIIMIDDADDLFAAPFWSEYSGKTNLIEQKMRPVFEKIIRDEFRYRKIALIAVIDALAFMSKFIYQTPLLRIFFKLRGPCCGVITEDEGLSKALNSQEIRQARIHSRYTREVFIKT